MEQKRAQNQATATHVAALTWMLSFAQFDSIAYGRWSCFAAQGSPRKRSHSRLPLQVDGRLLEISGSEGNHVFATGAQEWPNTPMNKDSPTLDKPFTPPQPAPRQIADLPGPRGIPVLGNLLQLDPPRMHQQLEQWCKEFGPFFRLKVGRRHLLIVGDHQAVAAMLRDRPDGFKRTTRLEQVGREMGLKPGVFGADDDDWRRQRRMVMAGFDPAHVKGYFPSLQVVADRLVRRWQKAARDGSAIDLQADLMRYTVDTIAGLAFGAEVNTLESDGDVIQQHLDKIFPRCSSACWRPCRRGAGSRRRQTASLRAGWPRSMKPSMDSSRRQGGAWRPTPRCAPIHATCSKP